MEVSISKLSSQKLKKPRKTLPATVNARPWQTRWLVTLLILVDALTLCLIFASAYYFRFIWLSYEREVTAQFYAWLVYWFIPVWLCVFAAQGLYNLEMLFGGTQEYARIFQSCMMGMVLLVFYSFLERSDSTFDLSRGWLAFVAGFSVVVLTIERFVLRRVIYALRNKGHLQKRVVIVGANFEGQAIAGQLYGLPSTGLKVVGFIGRRQSDRLLKSDLKLKALERTNAENKADAPNDNAAHQSAENLPTRRQTDLVSEMSNTLSFPVLGIVEDLPDLISLYQIDEVIVAQSAIPHAHLMDIFKSLADFPMVKLWMSPGVYDILTTGTTVKEAGFVPLIGLNRFRITGLDAILKTMLDYGLILLSTPLLVPIMLLIAWKVRHDSPGPVLHKRLVVGQNGRMFYAYKFRTMVTNGDQVLAKAFAEDPSLRREFEQTQKLKEDPRITPFGRRLRRTSLDELPQLLNVLRGEMSLVGPRMISKEELLRFGKWNMNLLTVKPGLTGPWQVRGRNALPYKERVRLSMHYIRNYTIWSDLDILWKTIWVVLRGEGAY